jgi:S-adenosylmethionine hydrolase
MQCWEIGWRPPALSNTFHGRDLFAPAAALLAADEESALERLECRAVDRIAGADWSADHRAVVYFDRYGNAITGCRAAVLQPDTRVRIRDREILRGTTFGDQPVGGAFWYENANGLVEIAVNQGSARDLLSLSFGQAFEVNSTFD